MRTAVALLLLACAAALFPAPAAAADPVPTRYGLAVLGGMAYDPHRFGLALVQGYALLDYERVCFWQEAPEELRLRVEANLGLADREGERAVASLNLLAFRYLDRFGAAGWRPYLEAGIGVGYTDFKADGQGLRLNFNPQAGAGIEWDRPDGRAVQAGLRLHHLSNAGLDDDNRGINALLFTIGWLY
ncbi:MAG: acyloxyacyl hydrolase [Deltaproteobacteria bacterium]|nr:MAG: acyloxyacyl hydrolase [Deltaproteobacteria bacterium]